jgi:outer membrane receptor for ferrienterochelin and colicin
LRGAAFRTLKRTLITDQTLEPTQVAGFNQFYDDENGTKAWNYGVALDQKITNKIYGGAAYTYRDLDVPYVEVTGGEFKERTVDWSEKLIRSYLFWAPIDYLALRAEWLWERFDRDKDFGDGAKEVKTHYVPLGASIFCPLGFTLSFTGTYVDQDGKFERQGSLGTFENGDDHFWVFDTALSYRLPKRYGLITLGVSNLFDEDFNYFDTDRDNPRIQPDRTAYFRVTLALP